MRGRWRFGLFCSAGLRSSQRRGEPTFLLGKEGGHVIRREDFLYEKDGVSRPWQFEDSIRRELERARRYGSTFSFVLIGIDGHSELREEIGSEMLNALTDLVARLVHDITRTTDMIGHHAEGRVGALLPETPIEGAYLVAERLR